MLKRRARGTLGLRWVGSGVAPELPEEPPPPPESGYYVSPTGTATWAQAVSMDTPCAVATAFANAAAGDTVYFRGGTYTVPAKTTGDSYYGYYQPTNTGTAGHPITFMAFPGETPVFNGTASGGVVFGTNGAIGERIFGVPENVSYITFDGLSLTCDGGTTMASMIVGANFGNVPPYSTTNIIVKNCTFDGGSTHGDWHDNAEGLRVQSADTVLVQNCTFTNYAANAPANLHYNTSAYKSYHVVDVTVEHCTFSDSTAAIYDKSGSDGCIYRDNVITGCPMGVIALGAGYDCINGEVSGNLILRATFEAIWIDVDSYDGTATGAWTIAGNTIYLAASSTEPPIFVTHGSATRIYHNIVIGKGTDYNTQIRLSTNTIAEMDYNQFGTVGSPVRNEGNAYANLTEWRAALGYDTHSLESDPLFVNGSGAFTAIADFALQAGSPCKGAGKLNADLGCDVTTVGVQ